MQSPDHPASGPSPVITDIVVPVQASENREAWKSAIAERLGISTSSIRGMRLLKHSIDSRQRNIKAQLRIMVGIGADLPPRTPALQHAPGCAKRSSCAADRRMWALRDVRCDPGN